jgi:hypothetical protein
LRSAGEDAVEVWDAARVRLRDWYVETAQFADMAVSSGSPLRVAKLDLDPKENPFGSSTEALTWMDEERPQLMSVLREASLDGEDWVVLRIADSMWPYFTNRRPWNDFTEAYRLAVISAQRIGNVEIEARMRCLLSRPLRELSDLVGAREQVDAAGELVRGLGGRREASVLEFIGLVSLDEANPSEAFRLFEQAAGMHAGVQNRRGVILMLQMMGRALDRSGDYERAAETLAEALRQVAPNEERLQARIRMDLAEALMNLGRNDEAAVLLEDAVPYLRAQLMAQDLQWAQTMLRSAHGPRTGRSGSE